ncbi:MAG: response regulator [Casimicrobiaceae bacterium]
MNSKSTMHTILIADDEPDIVDTTALMLEACGYGVLRAYSAREALTSLDDHPEIALLVSDIRMPEVDGFDLLRVVRHRFGSLPVILMTGSPVTDEDIVPARAAILAKPFTYAALTRALSAQLDSPDQSKQREMPATG